jgi:RNA polymerase sigma-70 factor (ECF subfamily)
MTTKDSQLLRLLIRIQQRDEHAMDDFYRLVKPPLISFIMRIVRDVNTAEEVLQDTLSYVWVNASRYREDRGALTAWVYLIARSRALDALRRRRSTAFTRSLEDSQLGTALLDGEAAQIMRWREAQLKLHLQGLPATHRQLIYLAFFEGYSHAEIALTMNLPLGTVKTRIRTVLSRLREGLSSSAVEFSDSASSLRELPLS